MSRRAMFKWYLALGLASASVAYTQTCPNWSPKFDQIQSPAMKQAVQDQNNRGWDNVIAEGGDIQAQITAGEQALAQVRASLANATQCTAQIAVPGGHPPTPAQCDHLGTTGGSAADACMCQELIARDTILATEGTLELLRCRAGITGSGSSMAARTQDAQAGLKDFADKALKQPLPGDNAPSQQLPADVAQLASRGNAIEDECSAYQGAQYIDCSTGVQGYADDTNGSSGLGGNAGADSSGDASGDRTTSKDLADKTDDKGDSLDMLARDGTLKPEFVKETSDYTAVGRPPQGDCDAKVELTLLNATPSQPGGSTLHFGVNINDANQSGGDQSCVDVEYTVFATEHRQSTSGSGYSDGAGQTFHSKTNDTGPIDLPVNANGTNGVDLVGWRIVGATCTQAKNCGKKLTAEQCQELESFVNSVLPDKMMALIKQYGIKAQGQSMIQDIKSQLQEETSYAAGDLADLATKVKLLADTVTAAFDILVPEKGAAEAAAEKGAKITAKMVYQAVKNGGAQLDFTKGVLEGDLNNSIRLDFSESGIPKSETDEIINQCFSLIGLVKDLKTVQDAREFRSTLSTQLDSLQRQIDSYNAQLATITSNLNEMQAMRDGVQEACTDLPPAKQ